MILAGWPAVCLLAKLTELLRLSVNQVVILMSIFLDTLQLIIRVLVNGLVIALVLFDEIKILARLLDDRMRLMHLALMLVLENIELAG